MRTYWKYKGLPDYDYSNGGFNILCTFPWVATNGGTFTVNHVWDLFNANGHSFSGIIGAGVASSVVAPGVIVGSINNIDPTAAYWIKMTSPFTSQEIANNNTLNFSLSNITYHDGNTGFYMDQPNFYTYPYTGLTLVGYSEDYSGADKTLAEAFKWGPASNSGSQFHAGDSPIDQIIGANQASQRVWTGSAWEWQGTVVLRPGHGYWMRFTRAIGPSEGINFWSRESINDSITGALVGQPDYDGGASRTIGTLNMGGSFMKGYQSPSAFINTHISAADNHIGLLINPMHTRYLGFNDPNGDPVNLFTEGSDDGDWNQILDPNGLDVTNSMLDTLSVVTAAKRHMHGVGKVGPNSTTTNGLPVGSVTNWVSGTTTNIVGGYTANGGGEANGELLKYKIVTSDLGGGTGTPTMTIESGGFGKNFTLGETLTVTDPLGSNTANFVISEMVHDPNYQFYNSPKPARYSWGDNYGKTNWTWEAPDGNIKTCWNLLFGFEELTSGTSSESSHPGLLEGSQYDAMVANPNGASETSALQFRCYYEPHNKFYMLRLYTNGGVPISDANMTVAKVFNDYCYKISDVYGITRYALNQGYYFKMENFTDNPGASWSE